MTAMMRARPTTYRGTAMRSRLEARYAAWLDHAEVPWEYEPRCFADESGQYLPDFHVMAPGLYVRRGVYVEVKPTADMASEVISDGRMLRIRSSEPDAVLAVECAEWAHTAVSCPAGDSRFTRWMWTMAPTEHYDDVTMWLAPCLSPEWR